MATTTTGRWPIWTDEGTGSTMAGTARSAVWVYRLADGTHLTVGPDGKVSSAEQPTPAGFPIPLQWSRLVARLPDGPATETLVTDVEAAGGRPGRDLLSRLVAAVGIDPDAPALLIAEGVRVECVRGGWGGKTARVRGVEVKVTYYLYPAGTLRSE